MRDRRLRRSAHGASTADGRTQTPRVPRLRLGGCRSSEERTSRRHARGGKARQPRRGRRDAPIGWQDRHRPHALGDARPPDRAERASARRLHVRDRGHPQRDHRELPGAEGATRRGRAQVLVGDRHRGRRAPSRGRAQDRQVARGRRTRGPPAARWRGRARVHLHHAPRHDRRGAHQQRGWCHRRAREGRELRRI